MLLLMLMLLLFQGTNLWQSWLMCIFIVFIYVSRALYNIMALVFQHYLPDLGYGLINVTDQVRTSYFELILLYSIRVAYSKVDRIEIVILDF